MLTPSATASPSDSQDAAPAPEAARPSPPSNLKIAEDVYETCSCVAPGGYGSPLASCWHCRGDGYRLTRRVMRPTDVGEQQAAAIIATLKAHLLRAASTLDRAAKLLDNSGQYDDGQATRGAAKAVRECAQD